MGPSRPSTKFSDDFGGCSIHEYGELDPKLGNDLSATDADAAPSWQNLVVSLPFVARMSQFQYYRYRAQDQCINP